MSKVLLKYLPEESFPLVSEWFKRYDFHLKISKSRKTKLGDFRPAYKGKPNRISVNGDLNPYHFLLTLTHEVAHAATWEKFQNKVHPHGNEWKNIYSNLLKDMLEVVHFPEELVREIKLHLASPKASSCSDPQLYKALKRFDQDSKLIYLEELAIGEDFLLHGKRMFRKGKLRRSRFECIELSSRKTYLIHGHAEVQMVDRSSHE